MIDLGLALNISGAALFALVGVGVLVLSRGTRRGLAVGAAATTFGMVWVFQNLVVPVGPPAVIALIVFSALGAVACIALASHLVQGAPRNARRAIAALGVVLAAAWLTHQAMLAANDVNRGDAIGRIFAGAFSAFLLSLVPLVGALAIAFREAGPASRALGLLALAFAGFTTFLFAAFAGSAGFNRDNFGTGLDLYWLALGILTAALIVPFAKSGASPDLLSRMVFPSLVLFGFAGLAILIPVDDVGSFGVVRTLGAFFLALAVLKYDLLQVPLSRFAARRGTLATASLAALFIVAQIAQEFLSAEYGLLMGGVVAGALLFAASPIQRAIERLSERAVPVAGGGTAAPLTRDAADMRLAAYRAAVRAALNDGAMNADEEHHLAEVAQHLGIGALDALRMRREVEQEVRTR